eukprot:gi/632987796/ref/XP_007882754.1/ PREDICTED: deleted in malignant brain tumors 1 protein-like isoform X4 [Callorhinchus milii]
MCSGRVEILYASSWGTMCDAEWDKKDGDVVCRELNCGEAASAPSGAFFGRGNGTVWLDGVRCNGAEGSLDQCLTKPLANNTCSHHQDTSVICSGPVPLRLVDGNNMCSGRVEVLHNSTWGSVCGDDWDTEEANVICRLLNCGEATSATGNAAFGQGTGPVWLSDVRCIHMIAPNRCSSDSWWNHHCSHSQDLSLTCSGPVPVRVVNGNNMCSGRVEVLHNSTWGSVCGDHWGTEEANVVCRLLNCGEATSATGNATFGQGTGPVWLSDVRCEGSEAALDQCPAKPYGNNNCSHSQDAGVTCSGPVPVRLVNGNNMCSGRVEVLHNSIWKSVCGDHWGTEEANVVCNLLNCGKSTSTTGNATFGQGTGRIWLSDVRCNGTEAALDQCPAKPYGNNNCSHSQDAGVTCSGPVPVRLVNGNNMCSGRVEVLHDSTWGSVCGDHWGTEEANVVCRLLNCGDATSATGNATFGQGTGPVWVSDVRCNGTEAALDQCPANPYGNNNCCHSQDASVTCSGPVPVRLVDGNNMCSGRVEVLHNSTWGSVCGDHWGTEEATVVCRLLNCGEATSATGNATFGQGTGPVWLSDVRCNGTEAALDQCPAKPYGNNNCSHSQDAGLTCSGPVPVRLVNGNNMCSGRVEVLHNSTWGSVCGDHWGTEEANVVCRLLDCGEATSATGNTTFGQGTGPVWLSDVRCNGTEAALDQCPAKPYGINTCHHSQGASVTCSGPVPVRLVNGNNMCSGRVEVLHNSTWGSVCGDHWGTEEATVVCRLLNCGEATSATGNASFGQGTGPVWLSDVRCNGTEAALDQCPAKPYGNNNCRHSQDAGLTCSGPVPVRLVNGNNMCSGRVEVLHNSTWGSVCGDHWGTEEANVVCRLLNCGEATSATGNATFGQGTGPVWLSDVRCEGSEAALDQCPAKPYGNNNCSHSQDAGVTCSGPVPVRVVNGNNMCSGRVEVLHNSTWGSVCGDHWGTEEATVVCRLLNCGEATSATENAVFGQGTGPVWLSDVRCNGTEPALDQCPAKPYGNKDCGHSQDTGVTCSGPVPVRLVNGNNMCSGRVEVFHNSTWGSVCGDHWGTEEASVVCRLLNCGEATSATGNAAFGQGTGPVWLSDVRCNGAEAALDQCPAKPYGNNNCSHSQDASVTCSGPVPVRLVDGNNMCSGRVEVFHNSTWGSVCGDNWGSEEANVVCRLLNCGEATSATRNANFGQGIGPVWLSDVRCNGTEAALDQCPAKPYGNNKCSHSPDAGVACSGPVPVRLVNGNNMCSGRVEVLHNSTWGSVCGDHWGPEEANVICRLLDCGEATSATGNATFGRGTGPVWLSDVRCDGKEDALDQCLADPYGTNTCSHSQDASVTCSGPVPVRLVNGNNMCTGRVEVLHNSTWGSVCGDHWGTEEANVICRLLNCGEATSATGNATFGQGTGPVWLSDVRCNGTAAALDQCRADPYGTNTCSHSQDASVTCSGPVPVRLVNGNNMCSGRVEVLHNSTWGSVCGDHWGTEEANVVCRLLNCGKATSATGNATFGQGTGPVWLSDMRCNGTEVALDQCPAKPYGNNNCSHSQDAGVICSGPVPVRMVDGNNMCSGRVEVLHNSIWGTVCGDHWGTEEANVVCRLLNCGEATSATGNATFGQGTGRVWLSDLRCSGSEAALDQCPAKPYGNNTCHHRQDASVTCSGPVPVRLVDGNSMCSGRVEVLHNSTWGSVCGDHWDFKAASVVCRLLNCGEATSATVSSTFGRGTGRFWLSDVRCKGTEPALDQCMAKPYGINTCLHSQNAGVICSGPVPIRLMNGSTICSGRVEVFHICTWGSVCGDHWGMEEANVVCRLLNCGEATSATGNATFGQGTGPVWLSDMRCEGTEVALDQCPAKPYGNNNCSHSQDAGVTCSGKVSTLNNKECIQSTDLQKKRVSGTVSFVVLGYPISPDNPVLIQALEKMLSSIFSAIPGGRLLKLTALKQKDSD